MPETKRMANFELLRIIAMMMVVTMHYIYRADLLPVLTEQVNEHQNFGLVIESLCIVAVNVFVMISGYFMVKSPFKFRRFCRLLCQVIFYSLTIPLALSVFGLPIIAEAEGVYGFIQYILPISTVHYWFVTAYLLLYLISPFLNAAFEKIEKKQLEKIILILLLIFCGIKSFVPVSLNLDTFGYDFGWFICLYLTGGYIRIYGLKILDGKKRGLFLYLISVALIYLLKMGSYILYTKTGLLKYFYDVPFHYNFILVYLAAIGLFYAFMGIKIKEGRFAAMLRGIAPLCLGVYLLHMHIDISGKWYGWMGFLFDSLLKAGYIGMILKMLVSVLFIFVICIIIDFVRYRIFTVIEKNLIDQYYAR
ncbi:MAG: acyltransferase family protein [Lachnospiraceae bacterium]|nr:acyltransferase family protein [Lachnospiraceae bacterium]